MQAGSLEIGERVRTYAGDTEQVVSLLPRPGPEPVFNLEVHAEHVYYVGNDGTLVHNSGGRYRDIDPSAPFGRKLDGSPKAKPGPKIDINAPHNRTIREIIEEQEAKGLVHIGGGKSAGVGDLNEITIKTPEGTKPYRRMNASFLDPKTGEVIHFNVGLKNKRGDPISRERAALIDAIKHSPEFKTQFRIKFREYTS